MKKTSGVFLLFLLAVALASLGIMPDGSRAADNSKITIAYSGNLMGYTEPCG